MMAMKFFRPSLHINRELEFDIWRESNLVESYGTSKEGLALAAARRGFSVFTIGEMRRQSFVDTMANKIPGIDNEILELLYSDTRRKFRAMRLRNLNRKVRLNEMRTLLQRTHIPIVLTDTSLFGDEEALSHWIVLTGCAGTSWYINNPLAKSANTRVNQTKLSKNLGYRGVQCAVVVRGLKRRSIGQSHDR
jgi:hypothetical protein